MKSLTEEESGKIPLRGYFPKQLFRILAEKANLARVEGASEGDAGSGAAVSGPPEMGAGDLIATRTSLSGILATNGKPPHSQPGALEDHDAACCEVLDEKIEIGA